MRDELKNPGVGTVTFVPNQPKRSEQIRQIQALIRGIDNMRRIRDCNNAKPNPVQESFDRAIVALNQLITTLAEEVANPLVIFEPYRENEIQK